MQVIPVSACLWAVLSRRRLSRPGLLMRLCPVSERRASSRRGVMANVVLGDQPDERRQATGGRVIHFIDRLIDRRARRHIGWFYSAEQSLTQGRSSKPLAG